MIGGLGGVLNNMKIKNLTMVESYNMVMELNSYLGDYQWLKPIF